jgi:choline dehydrogenase-like flavoprotein
MNYRGDVIVIGSGPAGSAVARTLRAASPGATVIIVEAGPIITEAPGTNVLNIKEGPARTRAQERSEGPGPLPETSRSGNLGGRIVARPGTFLVQQHAQGADPQVGMPAAAMSSNVGGMGSHWTCACPEPGDGERIEFIERAVHDQAMHRARELLGVTTTAFDVTTEVEQVRRITASIIPEPVRGIGPMPMACHRGEDGKAVWGGTGHVLHGILADPEVTLLASTLCRRILWSGGRAVGVEAIDLLTHQTLTIHGDAVVVAADALRSPQLLWASGIRPSALGRNLNDQPQIVAGVRFRGERAAEEIDMKLDVRDRFAGVTWVPYDRETHPYHGQILQLDAAPIAVGGDTSDRLLLLSWFVAKDIRPEDRVDFTDARSDRYGMPAMTIDYSLSAEDQRRIDQGLRTVEELGLALGDFNKDTHPRPRLQPAGTSLHYQGTVRMGAVDDGSSVCDADGRVWGMDNVFVAGNGVIPTETACNPTLTTVALATLTAKAISKQLAGAGA